MTKETIHIIGGGITGCAFAYFLKKDFDVIIYEKSPDLGGLIRTRYNLENIPWQQVPGILHTDKDWIIDLFSKWVELSIVDYRVAMDPLFDFRYYDYPFNKSTIDTMPWHWKEAILADLEKSNGEHSEYLVDLIKNFYGENIYEIFYKNYIKKMFGTLNITISDWYKPFMRDIHSNFSYYIDKNIMFPINQGWNPVFNGLTEGVKINYNSVKTRKDFQDQDIIVLTTDVSKFFEKTNIYSHGSFDIDSTLYKDKSPDTLIYPNYTPFIYMTQYGKFFTKHEKNIIVKTSIDDGEDVLSPIPTKTNMHIYNNIVKDNPGVIFAGRAGSWSFMEIDGIMDQAQKISAQIKHSRRNK